MLDDLAACAGDNKACRCRYVEGVFAVTSGAYDVNRFHIVEVQWSPTLNECIAEADQFVKCYAAHEIYSHERRELRVVISSVSNVMQHIARLIARKAFVFKHFI